MKRRAMATVLRPIKDLVTLVTGGASGLGLATVKHLIEQGAKVAVLDLPSSSGHQDELGSNCIFTPADVTSESEVKAAMVKIKQEFGRLDATVHCAGIAYAHKIYSVTKRRFGNFDYMKQSFNVNIVGSFNVAAYSIELMSENEKDAMGQRGVIVNTSSTAMYDGQVGQTAYAASNGAVASLTLPLARELAGDGIRILSIAPGIFDTKLALPPNFDMKARYYLSSLILCPERFGSPKEFAFLVQHLIENPYINGEVIRIDGGLRTP